MAIAPPRAIPWAPVLNEGAGMPFRPRNRCAILNHIKTAKMRQILVMLSFLVVGVDATVGQNIEVRLISGIGISPSNLDSKSDWIENEIHSNLIPVGLDANYFFFPEKRLKLFFGTGLEYSNNSYFQNVMDLDYGYNLQSIRFSQQHLGIPIRIGSEWNFFNGNSIGFQFRHQYNFAMKKEAVIQPKDYGYDPSVNLKYNYTLTSRTWNFRSNALSLYLKTQLANNLYLLTAIDFEFRPWSGEYDFRTGQIRTKTDITTGEQYQEEASYVLEGILTENNILGLKLGLTKYF